MTIGTGLPAGNRYRLDSRIATGGMGEVWRATDTLLGRSVALKLLKMEYADDPTFRSRFETEARHAASLQHPGIAAVFDVGEVDAGDHSGTPRPFLVMELVNGRPLSELLRSGRALDPDAVRDLLAQAADALGAAHAAGIVHRDVKPANLLVTPDRRVKITDFGIARAADALGLTGTGQVMGTPQYLSPEQARGEAATPASDVYGLGVVAYECLAGRRPFEKETPVATALAHVNEPVPELPAEVPADLARVVSRALAKDPGDRFADGRELAAALRDPSGVAAAANAPTVVAGAAAAPATRLLTGAEPGPLAPTPPPGDDRDRRRRSWLVVLLLLLLALLAGLLLWQLAGGDEDPTSTPTQSTRPSPSQTAQSEPTEQTTEPEQQQPTEQPTEQPSEEPEEIVLDLDDYLDKDVDKVVEDLRALGLDPQPEEIENTGDESPGKVAAIEPSSGLVEGDAVTVQFWGEKPEEGGNEGEGNGNGGGNGGGNGNSGEGSGGDGSDSIGLPLQMTTQGDTT